MSEEEKNEGQLVEVNDDFSSRSESVTPKQNLSSWRMNSPMVQMGLVSCIVGCAAGIYCATNGLGVATYSAKTVNTTIAVGDVLWVFSSLFAGSFIELLSPRICMAIGALAYPIYTCQYWIYDKTGNTGAVIALGGVVAGILFGPLWSTQNYLVTSYATESTKGLYVAINWSIINIGASIGALIAIGLNASHTAKSANVGWDLYLVFICINMVGVFLSFFLKHPKDIVRNDGTKIAVFKDVSLKANLHRLGSCFKEKRILVMILPLFTAETILSCAAGLNGFLFNVRTRTLNNFSFWFVQIPMAFVLYSLLDKKGLSRRTRGYLGLLLTTVFVTAFFVGFYIMYGAWGPKYFHPDRPDFIALSIDWTETKFGGTFVLYVVAGIAYGLFMDFRLWVIGAFSNDPEKLSNYSSIVPALQACGISVGFGINASGISIDKIMAVWFAIYMVSIPLLFFSIKWYVVESNYHLEDNVIVPKDFEDADQALRFVASNP